MSTVPYDGSLAPAPVINRRLGNVLTPARNLYMVYMPLFMIASGLICWLVPTDFMLIAGSVALSLVALYTFFDLLLFEAPIRVTTLLVTILALGYGLGAANTWFTTPRGENVSLGEYYHRDPAGLAHTMGSLLISLAIVMAIGEMAEKPIFGEDFELELPTQGIFFIGIGVLIIIAAYIHGSLNFMGAFNGGGGAEGIFPAFSFWLIGTLLAVTFVSALNTKSAVIRRYLLFLTLIQFVMEIPIGRRNMVFNVVLTLLALRLGKFRFNWSWPKRFVVGIILACVLYVASIGFFYLRVAGYTIKGPSSIFQRISVAIIYFETKDYEEVQAAFANNVQRRTFILGFLSSLETLSTQYTPGLGRDAVLNIQSVIPSLIYPNKDTNSEEGLADELFGSTFGDEANSILTAGVVDFGFMGMILYPLAIAFMIRAFLEFIGQKLPNFVATFVILAAIGALLQPETSLSNYFLILRNSILFGAVVWFFIALPAFRLRRDG